MISDRVDSEGIMDLVVSRLSAMDARNAAHLRVHPVALSLDNGDWLNADLRRAAQCKAPERRLIKQAWGFFFRDGRGHQPQEPQWQGRPRWSSKSGELRTENWSGFFLLWSRVHFFHADLNSTNGCALRSASSFKKAPIRLHYTIRRGRKDYIGFFELASNAENCMHGA